MAVAYAVVAMGMKGGTLPAFDAWDAPAWVQQDHREQLQQGLLPGTLGTRGASFAATPSGLRGSTNAT